MKFAAFLMMFFVALGGCASMSDQALAENVYDTARSATKVGLRSALEQAHSPAEVREKAELAVKLIRENVVPLFTSTTEDVLLRTVETVLQEVADKLDPIVVGVMQVAIGTVLNQLDLPENPAAKLSPRTKGALLAMFNGLADGATDALKTPPPTSVAPRNAVEWAKAAAPAPKMTLTLSNGCKCDPCKCGNSCKCDPCKCNPCKCACKCDPCKCNPCVCGH